MAKEINRFVIGITEYRSVSESSFIGIHNTLYCYSWSTPSYRNVLVFLQLVPKVDDMSDTQILQFHLIIGRKRGSDEKAICYLMDFVFLNGEEESNQIRGEYNPVWDVSWTKASQWSSHNTTRPTMLEWTRNRIILYPRWRLFKWLTKSPRFRELGFFLAFPSVLMQCLKGGGLGRFPGYSLLLVITWVLWLTALFNQYHRASKCNMELMRLRHFVVIMSPYHSRT